MDAFSEQRQQDPLFDGSDIRGIDPSSRISPQTSSTDGLESLRKIFNTLRRRRRLIFYSIGIGGVLVLLISIILPPSYFAAVQLILDTHRTDAANPGAPGATMIIPAGVEEAAIDTHITALGSDANLRRSLQSLHVIDEQSANDPKETTAEISAALIRLHRNLKIVQERRSRIISVGYYSSNPAQAAEVANTIAQVYVNSLRDEKREGAELAVDRFTQRLADVRDQVAQAENRVQVYRQEHATDDPATPGQTERQITQGARQLVLLKSSSASTQQRLNDFKEWRSRGGSLSELARILDSARLSSLATLADAKLRGGPEAESVPLPKLLQDIDDEIAARLARLEAEQRTYQAQIQSVESRLALLRRVATQTTDDTIGLHELERKATALGQLYETLLRQRQDLVERSKLAEPDIRILAPAEAPLHPSSLRRVFLIPPALIAFALLGSMIALAVDRFDHTLHGERETAEALQVPCAGLVPQLTSYEARSIPRLLGSHPDAPYSKAIRSIFSTIVRLCRADPDHKIVLVTSSVPREGKTDLAWSLAISAAQAQWSVLVLEIGRQTSPLRSQALDSIMFPTPATSLSEVMPRQVAISSLAGSIPESGISFIPFSCSSLELLAQLANPDFVGLIDQMRDTYDLVIVDAPSMLECSEVRLLANKADKVLFAVHWGRTTREIAHTAIRILQDRHGTTGKTAAVLTNVDLKKHETYRFADQGDLLSRGSI